MRSIQINLRPCVPMPSTVMMIIPFLPLLAFALFPGTLMAQPRPGYWQQEAHYVMDIRMDVETHRYTGTQRLTYVNHSPDTLDRVYYHLYFNAFQPGSMMDVRSRTIQDPDRRVGDRISRLAPDEIGYLRATSLTKDGRPVVMHEEGTVLIVHLEEPIPPGANAVFEMEMEAQVPVQIRRSGRNSAEGIEYSMAQWYPKMAAYDEEGWHPNPYIGREFYAPFGTFDVTIHIDRRYVVAAGAVLQNPQEVGYGYEAPGSTVRRPDGPTLAWRFMSENIHDFMWAADPDYVHTTAQVPGGPLLRFFHQADPVAANAPADRQSALRANWEQLPDYTVRAFAYASERFGAYPYPEYSVIQGGDGGMEYIMGTLITGNRSLESLVGVTIHEFMHSWYMGVLGFNESYDAWMDEGFTSYATDEIMAMLFSGDTMGGYRGYYGLVRSGLEEPLSTHSDHYATNSAYGAAAYSKGSVFLSQAQYIIGKPAFDRAMLRFFDEWGFRHPDGKDLLRIFERESGMVLDWYYDHFVNSTRTVDYAIDSLSADGRLHLSNAGQFPMPIDLRVTYRDGRVEDHYIPLQLMRGEKPAEDPERPRMVHRDWRWVDPAYVLDLSRPANEIERIEIDPSGRLADIRRDNNAYPRP